MNPRSCRSALSKASLLRTGGLCVRSLRHSYNITSEIICQIACNHDRQALHRRRQLLSVRGSGRGRDPHPGFSRVGRPDGRSIVTPDLHPIRDGQPPRNRGWRRLCSPHHSRLPSALQRPFDGDPACRNDSYQPVFEGLLDYIRLFWGIPQPNPAPGPSALPAPGSVPIEDRPPSSQLARKADRSDEAVGTLVENMRDHPPDPVR